MLRSLALLLTLLALLWGLAWPLQPLAAGRLRARGDSDPPLSYAQDAVIVKLEAPAAASSAAIAAIEHLFGDWHRAAVRPGETPAQALERLAHTPGVVLAELDYIFQLAPARPAALPAAASQGATPFLFPDDFPDDPLYPQQWHLPAVQAAAAWELATGEGVIVAVLDSGIAQGSDLACHTFVHEYNAITGVSGAGVAHDDYWHGTHVAGTIAQCTGNGIGVAGVAFDALLMPVKVLNHAGQGTYADVARGVDWARSNGARVINLSLGGPCSAAWPTCSNAILNDAIAAAAAADIFIAAAAGNYNGNFVANPGNHPDTVAVAGVDFRNLRAPYSNRGAALNLAAPGGDVRRDDNGDGRPDGVLQETFATPGGWDFYYHEGTSMATAHVSAAAALLRGHAPWATRQQVQEALQSTALDLGEPGFDVLYGHGLVQIRAALEALVEIAPPPDPQPLWLPYIINRTAVRLWLPLIENMGA